MAPEERIEILLNAPSTGWAAFSKDESQFVTYGESYEDAAAKALEKGEDDPVLVKIPEKWTGMVSIL